jgi:hypothetical protein
MLEDAKRDCRIPTTIPHFFLYKAYFQFKAHIPLPLNRHSSKPAFLQSCPHK